MNVREPILKPVAIADLRPTQMTVGFREVREKSRQWRKIAEAEGSEYLGRHMIPTVLGPKSRHYAIDHHHLMRALHDEGVAEVLVTIVADLSHLKKTGFWTFLDNRAWCHPYDSHGVRRRFEDIPDSVSKLADDPYRSLSGELRRAGGYAKDASPFSEFVWADFLRSRIKTKSLERSFPTALAKAVELAKSREADYLPGWCGPNPIG